MGILGPYGVGSVCLVASILSVLLGVGVGRQERLEGVLGLRGGRMSLRDDLIDEYTKARKQAKEARHEAFMSWVDKYGYWALVGLFGAITSVFILWVWRY